jgi:ParB family chromosome partitioning protein
MSNVKGGLGRGLASLIPQKRRLLDENDYQKKIRQGGSDLDEANAAVLEVSIEHIGTNPFQPRREFDEQSLQELSSSIKTFGVIQPLVVSPLEDGKFELVAGERRLRASKLAGLSKVPVVIRKKAEDLDKLELALVENIQRENLSPLEEARAYRQMADEFAMTHDEIAEKVGKSRPVITNRIRLLSLPVEVQKALEQGKISEGHARALQTVLNPEQQRSLFKMMLEGKMSTVRDIENAARNIVRGGLRVRKHKGDRDPEIIAAQEKLAGIFGTRVNVKKGAVGGKIEIDFYSEDEYKSLLDRLSRC